MASTGDLPTGDLPIIPYETSGAWEQWLTENHANSPGVWMKIAKKSSGIPTITYPEAVEVALCIGWIDGQRKSADGQWFLQRFTPRRSKSNWSEINREKVAKLTKEGRMHAAGLAEVERAKADGRWNR
jgi:uncharacterized protein YdeI (YjbR/CyaY-like superfamily)